MKQQITERTGLPSHEQRLIFDGKQLEDEKHLNYYRIDDRATLFLVMRLEGGAERPAQPVVRNIDPSVPRSNEACMIMLTEEDNVVMPCGHVISPDGLIDHSWNEICENRKTKVCCCLCNREWDTDTIRRYGGATSEEIRVLQECVSRNFILKDPNISECPGCSSFCERINTSDRCAICRICSQRKKKTYHFCWDCKKEWIGSPSNKRCGNDKCNQEELLEQLRTCPEKEIKHLKGLMCPSLRACPSCGSLVEHVKDCKHIFCKACKKEFCFVCLRLCAEGSSSCGSYNTQCAVAPRQTDISHT